MSRELAEVALEMGQAFAVCTKVGIYTDLDHYTDWLPKDKKEQLVQILLAFADQHGVRPRRYFERR